jgi:glycosyltransferase involved in cell wall biosynthesis
VRKSITPENFFLVPSALAPHKNIPNLVKAIDELRIANDSPYFIFIGAYSDTEFQRNYKSDRIIVYGYVDVEFLNFLYANCMGVILPSVYEGFGMPYAEALFAQKVVVASDIAIAREILNDNAVYIKSPFDSVQIQIALKRLMDKTTPIRKPSDFSTLKAQTTPSFVANKYINVLKKCLLQGKEIKF